MFCVALLTWSACWRSEAECAWSQNCPGRFWNGVCLLVGHPLESFSNKTTHENNIENRKSIGILLSSEQIGFSNCEIENGRISCVVFVILTLWQVKEFRENVDGGRRHIPVADTWTVFFLFFTQFGVTSNVFSIHVHLSHVWWLWQHTFSTSGAVYRAFEQFETLTCLIITRHFPNAWFL